MVKAVFSGLGFGLGDKRGGKMIVESPFCAGEAEALLRDFDQISLLHPEEGDLLAVSEGALKIMRGGFLQAPTRTIYELIKEGYQLQDSVAYLEKLNERTLTFLKGLKGQELGGIVDFQYRLQAAARKVVILYRALYGWNSFSTEREEQRDNSPLKERMKGICRAFFAQERSLRSIASRSLPPGTPYPKEPIDFDESVASRLADFRIPYGATAEDVFRLAATAEEKKTSWASNQAAVAAMGTALSVALAGGILLLPVKWLITNPIEYFVRGSVETKNPVEWAIENGQHAEGRMIVDPTLLINKYLQWFLTSSKIISEGCVEGFCHFSSHYRTEYFPLGPFVSTDFASSDLDELILVATDRKIGAIFSRRDLGLFGSAAKGLIEEAIAATTHRAVTFSGFRHYLMRNFDKLLWVEDPENSSLTDFSDLIEWVQAFRGGGVEERKEYYRRTADKFDEIADDGKNYISLNRFLRVVDALGKNPHCNIFTIPSDAFNTRGISERLFSSGFRECPYTFGRYQRSLMPT